jgi:dethiobiotin synthetase
MIALGVTGTDTGVGKTIVSAALAAAYAKSGARVGVMKPVETGVTRESTDRDGVRLAKAAGSRDDTSLITPYAFPDPLAPLVAARRVGAAIDIGRLDGAFRSISRDRDVVIVEGAGGLLVPLTDDHAFDTLFLRWKLGVLVVAANRLGVINHVRLTLRAARAVGLNIRAIVLNDTGNDAADASTSSNETLLHELISDVRVVRFPWVPDPCDHQVLASAAERSGLLVAVAH